MSDSVPFPPLSVLVYRDGGYWVAYCLELDVLTSATGIDMVRSDAVAVFASQVRYAIDHGLLGDLFRRPDGDRCKRLVVGLMAGELRVSVHEVVDGPISLRIHMHEPVDTSAAA